jgi:hypothetical protein
MDPKKIKFDDFVNKVNDTSKDPQKKFFLTGFVGNSPDADSIRIYGDISLSAYSQVKADDIIYQQSLTAESSPLGGSIIWVKADAKIATGNDSYHYDAQNNYFKGDIANAYAQIPTTGLICTIHTTTRTGSVLCRPTTGVRTVCDLNPGGNYGITTTGIKTVCDDNSLCANVNGPTTGIRTVCTDCQVQPLNTTTGIKTVCDDNSLCANVNGPTTGIRTICDGSYCHPTTGIKTVCDGNLCGPTTGIRTVCTDCQPQQPPRGASQYCGTGNYNPYI